MLDTFRDFLKTLAGDERGRSHGDDPRIAAAALMHHVSEADGIATAAEKVRLRDLLAAEYGLAPSEARAMEAAGEEADQDAVDLFSFTNVLMRHLGEAERIRFVELLLEIVFVDGDVHELEDNVVWRIAELLGVSSRDRMLGKREAAARRRAADG